MGGYGKSSGGDGGGKGSSPYGDGKGRCDPWRTTLIGIAWSKGWDKGFAKGSKGKGDAYGGWEKAAAPALQTAMAAKASSAAPVVPKATAAHTAGVTLLQIVTDQLAVREP
jgi:hypothetical protein